MFGQRVRFISVGWRQNHYVTTSRLTMILQFARRLFRRSYPAILEWRQLGASYATQWPSAPVGAPPSTSTQGQSPLEAFFDAKSDGPGIWKWRHYFDIYHRHLNHLRNRDNLVVLEIGIYSGGSIDMWQDYFGPSATIYGVDIESACRAYERPGVHVLIGDQADPTFWRRVLADGTLPAPDVVIDDGGHNALQQRITLEELLPRIRPGGVYLCEDVHGQDNPFSAFVSGLADRLNGVEGWNADTANPERRLFVPTNGLQAAIHSVHFYPYVAVIEKRESAIPELVAPKHGSQWQPFLR